MLLMEVVFGSEDLDRLEVDSSFTMGLPVSVVSAYRKRLQAFRAASDTRDFRTMKSWHFEKLKGSRSHQHSVRLNRQFRLILELESDNRRQRVLIVNVEDYH
jgi:proteic killer suppression protein